MRFLIYIPTLSFMLMLFSCSDQAGKETVKEEQKKIEVISKETARVPEEVIVVEKENIPLNTDSIVSALKLLPDSIFVEVNPLGSLFAFDMKYATADNFLGEKVYDCPKCLLRVAVVKALLKASALLKEKGYKIKFYDCFRPLYIQKKMWSIMPNAKYVGNPYKTGSIHNRGAAVDITLVDSTGKELDMGTKFDFFGEEAHHTYKNLPQIVLDNRTLLKEIMEKAGFKAQKTEWWHYSYIGSGQFPVSNEPILCDN